jgi:thioester reductase-like protein
MLMQDLVETLSNWLTDGEKNKDKPLPKDGNTHVLLTGATGFLGCHLLAQLLSAKTNVVHCLVRAQSQKEGVNRVKHMCMRQRVWNDTMEGRFHVLVSDLTGT